MPKTKDILFGEWRPDLPDLNNHGITQAKNVIPKTIGYGPFQGFVSGHSSTLSGRCLGAVQVKNDNDVVFLYAGDQTKLYRYTQSTGWVDASKAGGYNIDLRGWEFAIWGNQLIAVNGLAAPQIITLGGTQFSDLTTDVYANHIAVIRDFLVVGYTYDSVDGTKSKRIRWSAIGDITDWTVSASTQSDYQDLNSATSGGIIKAIRGGEYGVVFQEETIWRMSYVGSPAVFQFDETLPGYGTPAPDSVVQRGDTIYFLGQDGFYSVVNGVQLIPIGHQKIDQYFFDDLKTNSRFVIGAYDDNNKVIMWIYAGSGHTGNLPNKMLMYHWLEHKWSSAEIDLEFIFTGFQGEGKRIPFVFNYSHQWGYLLGSILPAEITSQEIEITPGLNTFIRSVRPLVDRINISPYVSIGFRNRQQDVPAYTVLNQTDNYGEAQIRNYARYQRIKISLSGSFKNAIGFNVISEESGDRSPQTYGFTSISLIGLPTSLSLAGASADAVFS